MTKVGACVVISDSFQHGRDDSYQEANKNSCVEERCPKLT